MSNKRKDSKQQDAWKPLFSSNLDVYNDEDEKTQNVPASDEPFVSLFKTQENLSLDVDDEDFVPIFNGKVKKKEKAFSKTETKPPTQLRGKGALKQSGPADNKAQPPKQQAAAKEEAAPLKKEEKTAPPEKKPEKEETKPPAPDPRVIENIKKRAQETGFQEGHKNGFESGKAEGYEIGFNTGREDGAKNGFETGLEEGRQAGYEEAMNEVHLFVDRLSGIIGEIESSWQNILHQNESQILELIRRIIEKVTFTLIDIDRDIVRKTIMHALEILQEPKEVTIYVNQEDYEFIEAVKEEFFTNLKGLKQVSVIPDPAVTKGGCRLETSSGEVDATIENRLEVVANSIVDAMGAS